MNEELRHHGVKGMKWGIRRFQNKDGSLTPAGKQRQRTFFRDEYGNKRKPSLIIAPQVAIARGIAGATNEVELKRQYDASRLMQETKNMTPTQKKIHELNYYKDEKRIVERTLKDAEHLLAGYKKTSDKPADVKLSSYVFGSDFILYHGNKKIREYSEIRDQYSNKIDSLLDELSDVKLKQVETYKRIKRGKSVYSWTGYDYVEDK